MMKKSGVLRIAASVVCLAFAFGSAPAAQAATGESVHVQAGWRYVTASSLTLWNAPSGGTAVGTWGPGQCFYENGIKGANRYRTSTSSGATVWVSADPAWSAPGC